MQITVTITQVLYNIGMEPVTIVTASRIGMQNVGTTQTELNAEVAANGKAEGTPWSDEECLQVAERVLNERFGDIIQDTDTISYVLQAAA